MAFAASPRTTLRASLSRFYQPPQPEFLLLASSPEARALSPFIDEGEAGRRRAAPTSSRSASGRSKPASSIGSAAAWRVDVA